MIPCIWYVSKLGFPWERSVIGGMAGALRVHHPALEVYVDGGTADFGVFGMEGALSWQSLTLLERLRKISSAPALWHLWGKAPPWWNLVRARSRTVHTSLEPSVVWKGHPTRLFSEQTAEGESAIKATFDAQLMRGEEREETPTSIFLEGRTLTPALKEALGELNMPIVDMNKVSFRASVARRGVFAAQGDPANSLLAACLAMQGLTVAGPDSSFLKELFGDEGYVLLKKNDVSSWKAALTSALSEEGRSLSISTRHRLNTQFSQAAVTESLSLVYRKLEKSWGLDERGKKA
ncbi:MAG: hypothetical protein GX256_00170 [Fretibacterium sp.]|nr:hypothetical protein [Fretibacterium sp.]